VQKRADDERSRKVDRVILSMRRMILSPVLDAWAELTRQRYRLSSRALLAAVNGGLGKAWRKWAEVAAFASHSKAALAKVARRLLSRDVGRAWDRWADMHLLTIRLRVLVRRMLLREATRGFNRWAEVAGERAERTRALGRGVRRLLHRDLAAAWYAPPVQPPPATSLGPRPQPWANATP
jgi:hypothetical protein